MTTDQTVGGVQQISAATAQYAEATGEDFRETYGEVSSNQRLVDFHEANTTAVANLTKSGAEMAEQLVRA